MVSTNTVGTYSLRRVWSFHNLSVCEVPDGVCEFILVTGWELSLKTLTGSLHPKKNGAETLSFSEYWFLSIGTATKTPSLKGYTKDFQNLITIKTQSNLTVKPILYLFLNEMGSKNTIPIPNSLGSQVILIRMKLPVSEDALNNDLNFKILPIFLI